MKEYIHYHKDGTIWAKGKTLDNEMHGYWEWYRKDGVIMRSGYFDKGLQVGEWITYDKKGNPYKVTQMKTPKNMSNRRPMAHILCIFL
jgi:antitoxin component YwqK of YwqJK toxin-antitoxin module